MNKKEPYFIIDFDSTFTKVEALDVLAEISLKNHPEKKARVKAIKEITNKGMEGNLNLGDSLFERLKLLNAREDHLGELITRLKKKVSDSFKRNEPFLKQYASNIYIISNGFKEFVVPVVEQFGIKPEQVFANNFEFGEQGEIVGYDHKNLLSQNNGKVEQIKSLGLNGDVYVIGDGYTDYEIKASGMADKFYAFTENISRKPVMDKADHIAPSLDEFLYKHKLPMAISYPKNRIKVLVLENIHREALKLFKNEGYLVKFYKKALAQKDLEEEIKDVSILCIRSKSHVNKEVLQKAKKLHTIGAFCIGTNQIDLEEATEKGIAVFNAPYSNTRSVVELAIAEIVFLMRKIPKRMHGMKQGKWDKSAEESREIRGKVLGIIGYGNIGSQLSVLAESMGMQVRYFDLEDRLPLGNAQPVSSLTELLKISDAISIHVDGRPNNKKLIGEKELSIMKKGAVIVNLARGHVLDIEEIKKAVDNGKIRGLGVDVFPFEPASNKDPFDSPLRTLDNVILTPHIGGSTEEAQRNIANYVPEKLMGFINTGNTSGSVNFPNLQLTQQGEVHRLIHIHENIEGVMARINEVLANMKVNILGQYLGTNTQIGYVITDINKEYDSKLIKELKAIKGTKRVRVLY